MLRSAPAATHQRGRPAMGHARLEAWVEEISRLVEPASVHWCDGSQAEIDRLNDQMVADGTLRAVKATGGRG